MRLMIAMGSTDYLCVVKESPSFNKPFAFSLNYSKIKN